MLTLHSYPIFMLYLPMLTYFVFFVPTLYLTFVIHSYRLKYKVSCNFTISAFHHLKLSNHQKYLQAHMILMIFMILRHVSPLSIPCTY
ncbi:hypothetical protein L228DRAFT_91859 [Xylona heveae TC161]|uniref:Uncharacterized protein n=1 Tax=Xylona heveae (strain CBS 132557 / TC161) TaxID=1328760 RepID=A0A165I1C8_XYLHT|nr:hypothetical protein L228DRAFT_91859 [Xylona heveae TC161]KZF24219.1 hypothetical protein L228DRAFT_91859 [Xylona heveae TC161]